MKDFYRDCPAHILRYEYLLDRLRDILYHTAWREKLFRRTTLHEGTH